MASVPQLANQCSNRILSLLPQEEYQALRDELEWVPTPLHAVLFQRDKPMEYAYFPLTGEHSIVVTMAEGFAVEVGTVGYEGFSNVDLILGGEDIATQSTVCEIPGEAIRMPAAVFRAATAGNTHLRRLCLTYARAYLAQVSQSVACNRFHAVEQRLARWLLMSRDRMRRNDFLLTQEYLATMLGVHRPSVSVAAGALQQAGMIRYTRGHVEILDPESLESACCECYGIVRRYYERFWGVP